MRWDKGGRGNRVRRRRWAWSGGVGAWGWGGAEGNAGDGGGGEWRGVDLGAGRERGRAVGREVCWGVGRGACESRNGEERWGCVGGGGVAAGSGGASESASAGKRVAAVYFGWIVC